MDEHVALLLKHYINTYHNPRRDVARSLLEPQYQSCLGTDWERDLRILLSRTVGITKAEREQ